MSDSIDRQKHPTPTNKMGNVLTAIGLGVLALVVFFVLQSLLHLRVLILPAAGILLILLGIYLMFAKSDDKKS